MQQFVAHIVASRFALAMASLAVALTSVTLAPSPALAAAPNFTFRGGGHGHGIGMSQYGAYGYAKQGKAHSWILNHYYAGTFLKTAASSPVVKVNLASNKGSRSSWLIASGNTASLTIRQVSNTAAKYTVASGTKIWITTSASNIVIKKNALVNGRNTPGATIRTFSGSVDTLTNTNRSSSLVQILSSSGPFSTGGIRWRGFIRFEPATSSTSRAVNYVTMQQYLYGVVPREMPSSWKTQSSTGSWTDSNGVRWNIEGLKAQAVAARSYAWTAATNGDVLWCTTMSQVYNGQSCPSDVHEQPSTNAAVSQTDRQLVWYGSETVPVTTYFSSSTGGRTASIQDVWTSSTPKPYYTSVSDADQASPDYTWTRTISSTTLSSRIRARDGDNGDQLDYSAPSPAYLTAISTERAASGFAHHVTLRWSNGASYRVPGTTLQSGFNWGQTALSSRLLSSKFTVSGSQVASTRYEQTDARLAWTGIWVSGSNTTLSGGSHKASNTAASTMVASFKGTGVRWIGRKAASYGKANVYIDGRYKQTIDLYASATTKTQTLFSAGSLASGDHTLTVKALGIKRSASAGTWVGIDAIDVIEGTLQQATLAPVRYEQSDAKVGYAGTWTRNVAHPALSGGSHSYTDEARAIAAFTFTGTEARWIGRRGTTFGSARVSIDGAAPQTVALHAAATEDQQVLWSATGLPAGRHTVLIEAVGDGHVAIDAIDVVGGWLDPVTMPKRRYEETVTGPSWTGAWAQGVTPALSGGSHRYTSAKGSSVTVPFTGTGVSWIGCKGAGYGRVNVYVDGAYVKTLNLYSATSRYKQTLFAASGLTFGTHQLKILALGTRDSRSAGTYVSVDAFDVQGFVR